MTAPTRKSRRVRLYAVLIRDEYEARFHVPEDTSFAAIDVRVFTYLSFLRSQADKRHGDCYALALNLIGHSASGANQWRGLT